MAEKMAEKFLPRKDVEDRCGLDKATVYHLMKNSDFPPAYRIGARAVRWKETEIAAWMDSRPKSA